VLSQTAYLLFYEKVFEEPLQKALKNVTNG
jgi:hypothetical protein